MMAGYNLAIPNGADRILALTEGQTDHLQKLEQKVVDHRNNSSDRGQWMAFGLAIVFGIIGTVLTLKGHDTVGGVVFGTTIVGLVTLFVLGKRADKKDLERKAPPKAD